MQKIRDLVASRAVEMSQTNPVDGVPSLVLFTVTMSLSEY